MIDLRRRPVRTVLTAAALFASVVAIGVVAPGQGRAAVRLAEPTTEGRFEGTWAYANRDEKIAIWLRDVESGPPEIKLRYQNTSSLEEFETDWAGHAEYYVSGQRALFEVTLTDGDRDRATGTWNWVVQFEKSGREEHGRFTMQRGYDGRKLTLRFEEFERRRIRGSEVKTNNPEEHSMTFVKASKRIVLWDELPF